MPPRIKSWFAEHIAAIIAAAFPVLSVGFVAYLDLRDKSIIAKCERDAQREALVELKESIDNQAKAFSSVATNLATLNTEVKHINTQLAERFYLYPKAKYKKTKENEQ